MIEQMPFSVFAEKYCERQQSTPEKLLDILRSQLAQYQCDGWFMGEAALMDSSWFGSRVIVPYGPNNTFKTIPDHPFSPRGLASDTSVVIGFLPADEIRNMK